MFCMGVRVWLEFRNNVEWHEFMCVSVEGLRESRAHQIVPFSFLMRPFFDGLIVSKGAVVRELTLVSMSEIGRAHV